MDLCKLTFLLPLLPLLAPPPAVPAWLRPVTTSLVWTPRPLFYRILLYGRMYMTLVEIFNLR